MTGRLIALNRQEFASEASIGSLQLGATDACPVLSILRFTCAVRPDPTTA
ncbi:hypothetical protein DENIT_190020 [Pseudomonas veronii]|nr:hypothetical protein DENIT_190020 [Pseudomonas veronii]